MVQLFGQFPKDRAFDPDTMVIVSLGDDVRTVRRKIDMDDTQYHKTWRLLNVCRLSKHLSSTVCMGSLIGPQTSAQNICHDKYGYIALKNADTLPGILALKDHHAQNKGALDLNTHDKIMQVLQVGGMPAWVVHNAIKRNYEKQKKGTDLCL